MAGLTDYAEERFLRHFFGGTAQSQPTMRVGLFTTIPTDSTSGNEVTGTGYARQAWVPEFLQNGDGRWMSRNSTLISFPVAGASWGSVVGFGLWDALTSGNCWAYALLTDPASGYTTPLPKTVDLGDSLRFEAQALRVLQD